MATPDMTCDRWYRSMAAPGHDQARQALNAPFTVFQTSAINSFERLSSALNQAATR